MCTLRKRTTIIAWVVGTLAVLGLAAFIFGPGIYARYAESVVDAPPSISAAPSDPDSTTAPSEQARDFAGTWRVAEGSYAGYRVEEVLRGEDVTVTGRTEDVTGSLTVDDTDTDNDNDNDNGALTLAEAEVVVDVGSIATNEPPRDAYFRETALQVGEYPTATFSLGEPVTLEPPLAGQAQDVEAAGELTLHGVTRPVSVELQAALTDTGAQVAGSIPITFSDFDVDAPSLGFVEVEDAGFVEFLVNLERD